MARRDADDDDLEADDERPRRKPPRPESIQPAKPRRPSPPDDDEDPDARSKPRRRPRDDDEEDDDDRPRRSRRDEDADDDDRPRRKKGGAIIPYRNGMALAAYYCGFGSLILILGSVALAAIMAPNMNRVLVFGMMYGGGGLCALLAGGFGVAGILKARRDPEARGTLHAIIGIVFGVAEVIGLIVLKIAPPEVLR